VAPRGSAVARSIEGAISFESCDARQATGRGEQALTHACEMLGAALGELIEQGAVVRLPAIGAFQRRPYHCGTRRFDVR